MSVYKGLFILYGIGFIVYQDYITVSIVIEAVDNTLHKNVLVLQQLLHFLGKIRGGKINVKTLFSEYLIRALDIHI